MAAAAAIRSASRLGPFCLLMALLLSLSTPHMSFVGSLIPERHDRWLSPERRPRAAKAAQAEELRALESEARRRGIELAVEKKLLPANIDVEPVQTVDLAGGADASAAEILTELAGVGDAGCVVVLQGEASDAKAAVVAELRGKLQRVEVWKMNTFYRAMTFMLLTFSEQMGQDLRDVLQRPEMLAAGIEMIDEMGEGKSIGAMADQAEAMMSMSSDASKIEENLPLSIEYGQGEVINFVKSSLDKIAGNGMTILLDGEEETLRYLRTPHRFQL